MSLFKKAIEVSACYREDGSVEDAIYSVAANIEKLAAILVENKSARNKEFAIDAIMHCINFKGVDEMIEAAKKIDKKEIENSKLIQTLPLALIINDELPASDEQISALKNFSVPLIQRLLAGNPTLVRNSLAILYGADTLELLKDRDPFKSEVLSYAFVNNGDESFIQAIGVAKILSVHAFNADTATPEIRAKLRLRAAKVPHALEAHLSMLMDIQEAQHIKKDASLAIINNAISAVKLVVPYKHGITLKEELGDNIIITMIFQKSLYKYIQLGELHKAFELMKQVLDLCSTNAAWVKALAAFLGIAKKVLN